MNRLWGMLVVLTCLFATGCGGPGKIEAKGKLTSGGAPLAVGEKAVVEVVLIPVVAAGEQFSTYPATFDKATGAFHVKELPAGKYRISVRHLDPYPTNDLLNDKFGLAGSPIVREVKANEEIVIDLAKPEG